MSRIYFHSPEDTAEVRGSERAYMGINISNWFSATLAIPSFCDDSPFFDFIPKDCYLQRHLQNAAINPSKWLEFMRSLELWAGSGDSYFVIDSYEVDLFAAQLNTAYLLGSDQVKLMARLHGQCELHCYVEAQNREWLAEIIQKGLATGIYRQGQEWESAIALLRNGCNSPVVTSFSVCDQFPSSSAANFEFSVDQDGGKNWDEWNDLDTEDQWDLGMKGLKSGQNKSLELNPESWNQFYFSHGWDAFKFNHLLAIPRSQWGGIVKAFSESKLPVSEAWIAAIASHQIDPPSSVQQ